MRRTTDAKYNTLLAAVLLHKKQKGDDRCWMDDLELYAAIDLEDSDGILPDNRVGCQNQMKENCDNFIKNRTENGGPWKSYEELLQDNVRLKSKATSYLQQVHVLRRKIRFLIDPKKELNEQEFTESVSRIGEDVEHTGRFTFSTQDEEPSPECQPSASYGTMGLRRFTGACEHGERSQSVDKATIGPRSSSIRSNGKEGSGERISEFA